MMGLVSSDSEDLHFDQGSTRITDSEEENLSRPAKRTVSKSNSSRDKVVEPERKKRRRMSPSPPLPTKKEKRSGGGDKKDRRDREEREERGAVRDRTNGRRRERDSDIEDIWDSRDRKPGRGRTEREREPSEEDETEDAREYDHRLDTIEETMLSMDELDASMISIQRPAKIVTAKYKVVEKPAPAAKTRRVKAEPIVEETSKPVERKSRTRKEKKPMQKKLRRGEESADEAVFEIPETQVVMEEILEQSIEEDEVIEELEDEPTPKPAVVRRPSVVRKQEIPARKTSVQPQSRHVRAGSFSDIEGGPGSRRKIGELQAKLDKNELRYRNLKEVVVDEAQANYEKLRKQSEESAKGAKAIIAQLKADSAAKDAKLKEFWNLQKALDEKDGEIAHHREKTAKANAALAEAKDENKGLMTKLAAMKNAAANIESVNAAKIPGSAQKPGATRIMGSAETVKAHQEAQLKISLYSDLTGLIIRGVKREEEEDVFDCIQTGKNGSKYPALPSLFPGELASPSPSYHHSIRVLTTSAALHFKLAVPNEKNASDDQAECHYIPMLDPSRDQSLKELLPEYLWDEISFQAKYVEAFYGKVITAMTPRKCHECA